MQTLRIKPILGTKVSVPEDDPSLFQWIGENFALTHDTGGQNVDYVRKENACAKAYGRYQWSNSAIGSATGCLGLFELDDGTNINQIHFDHGKFYYYDISRDPTNIDAATPITFATDAADLYSMIQFADYIVFADMGEHTPYKWKHGDANLTKLILSGTEYKFRYLLEFQRRIIGAYSDQTNGDIEIRWTDALPTMASLDFPSANQLYKPFESDPITGISKMGANAAYLYGKESICRIDYYPGAAIPLGITQTIVGHGAVNHHSIINDGYANYFFDEHYGFVRYRGEYEIKKENIISADIEPWISDIAPSCQNLIVGAPLPFTHEVCWTVPILSTTNNYLLFYNTKTGQWRRIQTTARYIDRWTLYSTFTWTQLAAISATWPTAATWDLYASAQPTLVFGQTDGHLYSNVGEDDNGSALDGYRHEPVMNFGDSSRKKRLLEIWFGIEEGGDYSIDVSWRGGDTLKKCKSNSWENIGSLNINNPSNAVLYCDKTEYFHQIKWGTDAASEYFAVPEIILGYQMQGKY